MAEIDVSETAADWLRDAEPDVRDRIMKKLRSIEDFPDHYLKRLSGSPYYRLRVGDYRVVIDWQRDENPDDTIRSRDRTPAGYLRLNGSCCRIHSDK